MDGAVTVVSYISEHEEVVSVYNLIAIQSYFTKNGKKADRIAVDSCQCDQSDRFS